jgi:hypothetical protein
LLHKPWPLRLKPPLSAATLTVALGKPLKRIMRSQKSKIGAITNLIRPALHSSGDMIFILFMIFIYIVVPRGAHSVRKAFRKSGAETSAPLEPVTLKQHGLKI